jgi:hypothetical protein
MTQEDMSRAVRDLVRGLDRAALATNLPGEAGGWPYASLVLVAVDHDLSPILLLSDLAEHTKAIAGDDRVSLLFDGTHGLDQPLTGPRVTLVGRAVRTDDPRLGRRFLARHPDARWAISSFDWNILRAIRSLSADAELWLLAISVSDELISTARELNATAVALLFVIRVASDQEALAAVKRQLHADLLDAQPIDLLDTDFSQYGSEPLIIELTVK